MIGIVVILLFMIAQGGAVFATAWLGLRRARTLRRGAKLAAMAISYAGWIAFTVGGYALLGGSGGLMEGFGLLLLLCVTALISSCVYAAAWVLQPTSAAPAARKVPPA